MFSHEMSWILSDLLYRNLLNVCWTSSKTIARTLSFAYCLVWWCKYHVVIVPWGLSYYSGQPPLLVSERTRLSPCNSPAFLTTPAIHHVDSMLLLAGLTDVVNWFQHLGIYFKLCQPGSLVVWTILRQCNEDSVSRCKERTLLYVFMIWQFPSSTNFEAFCLNGPFFTQLTIGCNHES